MTPRDQAIEEAAKALAKHDGHHLDGFASLKNMMYRGYARRAIDTYEKSRARLDGANTCPRCHGTGDDPKTKLRGPRVVCRDCGGNGYRATPKDGERG